MLCVTFCCTLWAKSDGGLSFSLARYSALVIGSTSVPTLAKKAASPLLYICCTEERLGCTPSVVHGCEA